MLGNLRKRVLKRKIKAIRAGNIELQALIDWYEGRIEYEKELLTEKQIEDFKVHIKANADQIEQNKSYIRFIEPTL
jgi:hypothetical protein